ncbi:unnamed protein product [Adineta ricciae]|uniref:FLYWCH-type domain-containing protein n=1 Tax=Adineta ricciae TaxID=249248 RepID=A0A815WWP2_ADIRI|nr:unnamed protein product [Adineta ricciae]CAF1661606.1 unnamed protein product [Adineta ricciae]
MKFWRCANRNCGMLLHTILNRQFVRFSGKITDHSHLPDPTAFEIRTSRERMRKRAENEILPLRGMAEQEVRKGLLSGEALAVLPNILNLGHNLVQPSKVDATTSTVMFSRHPRCVQKRFPQS